MAPGALLVEGMLLCLVLVVGRARALVYVVVHGGCWCSWCCCCLSLHQLHLLYVVSEGLYCGGWLACHDHGEGAHIWVMAEPLEHVL